MNKKSFRDKKDSETWLEYQFDYFFWFFKEHMNPEEMIEFCGECSKFHKKILVTIINLC